MTRDPRPAAEEIVARIARLRRFIGADLEALPARSDERAILERNLEVISEASRSLPDGFKAQHDQIDWRGIADIGNVLRHGYDRLLVGRLSLIINERLDQLDTAMTVLLAGIDDT